MVNLGAPVSIFAEYAKLLCLPSFDGVVQANKEAVSVILGKLFIFILLYHDFLSLINLRVSLVLSCLKLCERILNLALLVLECLFYPCLFVVDVVVDVAIGAERFLAFSAEVSFLHVMPITVPLPDLLPLVPKRLFRP